MAYTDQELANLELVRGLFRDVLEPMSPEAVDRYTRRTISSTIRRLSRGATG